MPKQLENANPVIHEKADLRLITSNDEDENVYDEIDRREIFDIVKDIKDPEYPYSLEELNVVQQELIFVNDRNNEVKLQYTPTITHCSMASVIGLAIITQLIRSLPSRFKINVQISPGSHESEQTVNKQLNDKERLAAAMENPRIMSVVNKCISRTFLKDDLVNTKSLTML